MTKKIERTRVEAGKAELPRKVSFLSTDKIDYVAVFDRDGVLTVEVQAAALGKLVKARGDLKALKSSQRQADAAAGDALKAEKESHAATQEALAKAERRFKALEKKLAADTDLGAAPAKPAATKKVSTNGGAPGSARKAKAPTPTPTPVATSSTPSAEASGAGKPQDAAVEPTTTAK